MAFGYICPHCGEGFVDWEQVVLYGLPDTCTHCGETVEKNEPTGVIDGAKL